MAIAGFLIKMNVPSEAALEIGTQVSVILIAEWLKVASQMRKLTISGLRAVVGLITTAFLNGLKGAMDPKVRLPYDPSFIPSLE